MGGRRVYLGNADAAAYSGAFMFCLRFIFVFFFPTTLIGATAKPISSNKKHDWLSVLFSNLGLKI